MAVNKLRNMFKLHYWPILTGLWFLIGFIITFSLAILQNHVYIPFISDTGTTPPESCLFGQVLNIGALLFTVTAYIRYRQVRFIQAMAEVNLNKFWNNLGLVIGILSSIGLTIVGNFQETSILFIHLMGAGMTFGFGSAYMGVQSAISYFVRNFYEKHPEINISNKILYSKIAVSVCCCLLVIVSGISILMALAEFKGESIPCWSESEGGFTLKLVATVTEWCLAICFICYLFIFASEYKLIEYEEIRFRMKFATPGNGEKVVESLSLE
ncbi:DNA damage-regulated autophagy modulator protein 2-like isoform X2 [Photinus pyralis]|nr:DNA damage-regulated autophagy modulator protein 2-like isoform X2 [Photinus pyralis]